MEHIFINIGLILIGLLCVFINLFGLGGNTILLIMAWIYGYVYEFQYMGFNVLLWLSGIYLLGEIWGIASGYLGIKKENISYTKVAIIGFGSFVGGIVATPLLPIVGSLLGAALGAFLCAFAVEIATNRSARSAWHLACVAAWMQVVCVLGKVLICVIMLIIFAMNLKW